MNLVGPLLMAVSLCADCFAVSLCSSVTLKEVNARQVALVAISFSIIQTGLLLLGWLFGSIFVGLVEKVAHIIGFLLLLYVGGSMFIEGIRGEAEVRDLSGFKNIIIGGIATSIDALAVGVAQSMTGIDLSGIMPLLISVAVVTALSVVCGICGGKAIGSHFGRWAEIAGGVVLMAIGVGVLI